MSLAINLTLNSISGVSLSDTALKPKESKKKENKYEDLAALLEKRSFSSLEERLGFVATITMQRMAADHFKRMEGYPQKISLLNEGIFYQDGLCTVMLELMQSEKTNEKTKKAIETHFKKMEKEGVFHHGAAPTSHFIIPPDIRSPTGKSFLKYCLKDKTITPSSALDAILHPKSRVFLTCTETCQVSYLKSLQETFGHKKFDYLFALDSPTPFFVGASGNSLEHLMYLLTEDRSPASKETLKQGEWVYFKGANYPSFEISIYGLKHINGSGGNWNTLCLDPQQEKETYIGLGLKPEGVTHDEIEETLVSEYNKTPIGFQGVTKEVRERMIASHSKKDMELAEMLKTDTLTLKKFRKHDGGKVSIVRSFDIDRVQQLIDATPQEGRLLLGAWKKEFSSHVFHHA